MHKQSIGSPRQRSRTRRIISAAAGIVVAAGVSLVVALPETPAALAAEDSVSVNFSTTSGAPTYRASGIIYGLTEDGSGPPDRFVTDMKLRFVRAGGAQLDSPGGWVANRYDRRWRSVLAQYRRTVAFGGTFVILPHDLWGADGAAIPTFPGDNGDWSNYDRFLDRLIADVTASGMNPQWDIWNEPDLNIFWNRNQDQYLQMWRRGYQRIRAAFPNAVIVGPSTASQPAPNNSWWTRYLDFAKANNAVPDIISWHSLSVGTDPAVNKNYADQLLSARAMGPKPYQINEYGAPEEQNPGRSAWYIARLERLGIDGLRANWGSAQGLHDNLAALLVKSGSTYQPRGDWYTYQSYASMTGATVAVTRGNLVDGYATKDTAAGKAAVLLGNHGVTGDVTVNLNRLDTTGLVQNGTVRAVLERVAHGNGGASAGRTVVFDRTVPVANDTAALTVPWGNASDAYAVTLYPPQGGPTQSPTPSPTTPGPRTFNSTIANQNGGNCADVSGGSTADGARLVQWSCHGGANQAFAFTPVSGASGQYTIGTAAGKCVDVSGISTADNAAIHQWSCHGGDNQKWQLVPVNVAGTDKTFNLRAVHSSKCIVPSGGSSASNAALVQLPCNSASSRVWRIPNY